MVAELIDCIEQEPRFFIKEMMGTPHCSLLILLAVASAVASMSTGGSSIQFTYIIYVL